jgi:LysR family transcriptional regulator of abg operon
MTLQQLRDLLSVLAHGGFRPAARTLSVSQAGLTKSVARLEEECGFALLDRTAKGIVLTPRGEAFLPYAQAVLGECDRAQQWIRDAGKRPVRRVGLGLSIEPSLSLAPRVLADFRQAMPEVTVHVRQCSSSELLARLRDNSIELAVMRLPKLDNLDDMRVEVLYEAPAAIVGRAGHPHAKAQSVRELLDMQWIVVGDPSRPSADDASVRELFVEQRLGKPRIAAVSDSLFGAIAMLTESDCVARLPRAILDHPLSAGQLVEFPVREQAVHDIALVRRSSRRLGREAQTLASMLKSFARVPRALAQGAAQARKRPLA